MDVGNEEVFAEILIENSRGVFGGQVGQDSRGVKHIPVSVT